MTFQITGCACARTSTLVCLSRGSPSSFVLTPTRTSFLFLSSHCDSVEMICHMIAAKSSFNRSVCVKQAYCYGHSLFTPSFRIWSLQKCKVTRNPVLKVTMSHNRTFSKPKGGSLLGDWTVKLLQVLIGQEDFSF